MLRTPKGITPEQKIRLAHDEVYRLHPIALAAVAARWRVIQNSKIPTFRTDGKRMEYNPAWADTLTLGQVACVVLHEITHVALGHTFRLATLVGGMNRVNPAIHDRWNKAADLAINGRLMEDYGKMCPADELANLITKGTFPRNGSYVEFPAGKSAEWYYAELQKRDAAKAAQARADKGKPQPSQGSQKGNKADKGELTEEELKQVSDDLDRMLDEMDNSGTEDGEGKPRGKAAKPGSDEDADEGGEGQGGDGDDEDEGDDEEGEGSGSGDGEGGDGEGSGSGSGSGHGEPGEPADAFGSIEPYALDPEEVEEGQREFEQCVTAAIVTDKSWGTEGGWFETSLTDQVYKLDPDADKIDWRLKLREFLTKVCKQGYTYQRPSRRHGWRTDIILPAHRGKGNSDGLLIVDTSGSMGDAECNIALRELEAIVSTFTRVTVKMISCDTKVMEGPVYTRNDFPIREPEAWKGRGGTDLSPAFRWAVKQPRNTYDWCIILTDMEWHWQSAPNPGIPTIWLSCARNRYYSEALKEGKLPFGTYIDVVV